MFAMFAVVVGLLFAMIGVGTVEASMTNWEMFYGIVWALSGLVFMWIGVSLIKGEVNE
jgi:threonine/homoserine/homoserine lactone efflux protein